MQNITCVLLIDKRLANYDEIIASANAVTACVVFDYDLDTFDTLKTRGIDRITSENRVVCTWIAIDAVEPEVREYRNIGLMQHNTNRAQYFVTASEPGCQLDNVAESDPSLTTWANYIDFINKCVRDYGLQTYDMMACALYSDANWKYVIDEMAARCGGGVTIRASLDNTGAAALGGNWFLELGGVNLKDVYFTDVIDDYNGLLAQTRISIPDFYASYGGNTLASHIAKDGWVIYSSVGTYYNEGLASLIKTSGSYIVGFITDKVTIGITGPTPFKIDSISWGGGDIVNSLSTRTAKTVKIYGSNTSYLGNISSSIISNNATLIATHQFQQVLEQTISINSTLYSSYYFDVLDNWGDASIKISGIVFNPGAPSNTVMADYTMSSTVYESTFTSHTFTNAYATGRFGPELSAVRSAYSSALWAQDTTNNWLNMSPTGIQEWTVPKTGRYTIEAYGAQGGNADTATGGLGARIKISTTLTKNHVIKILCGQQGGTATVISSVQNHPIIAGGGGGGTYIYNVTTHNLILIAGGGGGAAKGDLNSGNSTARYILNGSNASAYNETSGTNGTAGGNGNYGNGGSQGNPGIVGANGGSSGAGWNGSGSQGTYGGGAGLTFGSGGTGGENNIYAGSFVTNVEGGFGGGSGAGFHSNLVAAAGGGGGYSGGGGGGQNIGGGGGGGNYMIAESTYISSSSNNTGHGSVIISVLLTSPATLTFTKTAFYVKYVLNSTISIPAALISTNNSDLVKTVTHSSGSPGVATITTSANEGTVTVKGLGTTTITSTLAATANFDAVTVSLITITVIGSGSTVTGATMTSVDFTSTDLTGSVFSSCDLTSANLYGATFNAATDLRGSTLTSLRSGRIIGFTTLLPTDYKMI
jgi:hypothetical protein